MGMLRKISQQRWLPATAGGASTPLARFAMRFRERPQHPVSTSTGYQDIVARSREGRLSKIVTRRFMAAQEKKRDRTSKLPHYAWPRFAPAHLCRVPARFHNAAHPEHNGSDRSETRP